MELGNQVPGKLRASRESHGKVAGKNVPKLILKRKIVGRGNYFSDQENFPMAIRSTMIFTLNLKPNYLLNEINPARIFLLLPIVYSYNGHPLNREEKSSE